MLDAFKQDFEKNGPSLFRLIRTTLKGWKHYQFTTDKRVRDRFAEEVKPLRSMYAGAVWAMRKWYRHDKNMHQQLDDLLHDIYRTLGLQPRLIAPVVGRYIYHAMKRENKRMAEGWTIEPETVFEKNKAALAEKANSSATVVQSTPIQDLADLPQSSLAISGVKGSKLQRT